MKHFFWYATAAMTTAAAIAGGCGGDKKIPEVPEAQQAIAEEITNLGGLYSTDKQNPDLGITVVRLSSTKADDAMVARMAAALPELRGLYLNNTPITPASVEHFKKFTKLFTLDVGNTKLTPDMMAAYGESAPGMELLVSPTEPLAPPIEVPPTE